MSVVLYLDWDGVVNFFPESDVHYNEALHFRDTNIGFATAKVKEHGQVKTYGPYFQLWSNELLNELSSLNVEIVFLSAWRDNLSELLKVTKWQIPQEKISILDWGTCRSDWNQANKVPALIQHQVNCPKPFMWCDDEAVSFYSKKDRELLVKIPQLLITPDPRVGLTRNDLIKMRNFVENNKEWCHVQD